MFLMNTDFYFSEPFCGFEGRSFRGIITVDVKSIVLLYHGCYYYPVISLVTISHKRPK